MRNAQPYLLFGCTEINGAQVYEYLTCGLPSKQFRKGPKHPDDALYLDPSTNLPRTFIDPVSDPAPWYDEVFPESADFLGIWIEEITGTDSTMSRGIESRLSGSGGGVLGPLRAKERQLGFRAKAFALTQAGMEYGMRWFVNVLSGDQCDTCSPCSAEIRLSETSGYSPETGLWSLKNVGLIDGPKWTDIPLEGLGCLFREINWTMASEYPYYFKCPEEILAPVPLLADDLCLTADEWLCGWTVTSAVLESTPLTGETSAVISIYSGSQEIGFRIIGRGKGVFSCLTLDPDNIPPNDTIFNIEVQNLPASSTLIYDGSTHTIKVILPGGQEVDGSRFVVLPEGETFCYPEVRCGAICLNVVIPNASVTSTTRVSIDSVYRTL